MTRAKAEESEHSVFMFNSISNMTLLLWFFENQVASENLLDCRFLLSKGVHFLLNLINVEDLKRASKRNNSATDVAFSS